MVKTNVLKKFTAITLGCILVVGVALAADSSVSLAAPKIKAAVKNNKIYDLTNNYISSWLKSYSTGKVDWFGQYLEKSYPAKVKLKWKTKGTKAKTFILKVSQNPDLSEATNYVVKGKEKELDNLYTGATYFWRVNVKGKSSVKSKIYSFKTKPGFRTIRMPGVSNVRDLGGKIVYSKVNGKNVPVGTVKQGILYRSGKMNNILPEGKKIANRDLKIKTEFDLRKPGTIVGEEATSKSSVLGNKVIYKNISGLYYAGIWKDELNKNVICQEMRVLTKKNYYPILFHCAIGRDRTGTMAFLTNALLGVKKKDLYKDYEMTFFSVEGCLQNTTIEKLENNVKKLYKRINLYGSNSDTLAKKTELFLRDCGLSKKEIKKIKQNLIEYDD